MEKGKIKIRTKDRRKLTISGKPVPIPKEFDTSGFSVETHDCEVERDENGAVIRIVIDGVDVPKYEHIVDKKQKKKQEKKAEESAQQERKAALEQEKKSGDSFMLSKARVPIDTRQLYFWEGDNFHLKLNRFARFEAEESKFYFYKAQEKEIQANYGSTNFQSLLDRQQQNAHTLLGKVSGIKLQPDWRFIVGLGGASVYETSMTLHHIYGFPYIPASSVKGILRNYLIQTHFEHEGAAIQNEDFCTIFGCPAKVDIAQANGSKLPFASDTGEAQRGRIVFFDAYPTQAPQIKPDIMNPHYPEWYGAGKAPDDTQSPVPIYFLTVEKTPFQFLIGSKTISMQHTFWGKTLLDWLKEALEENGIGAKTAVGYGYMKTLSSSQNS
ncbi:MAG: type III-B CRISPR module RAMP protein Cmr6 [Bacteroidota bacterium]